MEDTTIGNQQERLPYEVAYLFGIIDGEGSYQLSSDINKQGRRYFSPLVTISNANPKIIDLCITGFNKMGVAWFVWTPKMTPKNKHLLYRLSVKGIKRMSYFLNQAVLIEHAKLPQAKLLKEFCDLRLSIDPIKKASGHIVTYTNRECEIKNELGLLNKEYNTRGRILRDYTLDSLREMI